MWAVISEFVVYLIKFVAMLLFAFLGIQVGKKIRANKDAQLGTEDEK